MRKSLCMAVILSAVGCGPQSPVDDGFAKRGITQVEDAKVYRLGEPVAETNYSIRVDKAFLRDRVGSGKAVESGRVLKHAPGWYRYVVMEYTVVNTGPKPFRTYEVPGVSLYHWGSRVDDDHGAGGYYRSEMPSDEKIFSDDKFSPGEVHRSATVTLIPRRDADLEKLFAMTDEGRRIALSK